MNLLTYLRTHSRVNILRHRFCSCLCTETSHLSPNPSKTQNPGKASEKSDKQGIFLPQPIHPSIHPSISTLSLCFSSLFSLYYSLTQSFSMSLFLSLSFCLFVFSSLDLLLSRSLPLFSTTHSFLIYLNS